MEEVYDYKLFLFNFNSQRQRYILRDRVECIESDLLKVNYMQHLPLLLGSYFFSFVFLILGLSAFYTV